MNCIDCNRARENDAHRVYDLRCVYCGARYMRVLRRGPVNISREKRKEMRDKVLADWTAYGHSPAALLELEEGEKLPYAPVTKGTR